MKIKLIDRVIVGLYAVLGAAVLVTAFLWTTGLCSAADAGLGYAAAIESSLWLRLGLCALLAALLAMSGHIIYAMTAGFRGKKAANQTLTLVGSGNGEVRVSASVLESLVRQAIGEVEGIKSMAVRLGGDQTVLSASLDITVCPGVRLGDVIGAMQTAAREALERFTGMPVKDVSVTVSAIVIDQQNKETAQSVPENKA